jgi:hypothetical protein
MQTDDSFDNDANYYFTYIYDIADDKEKAVLDKIFIKLCGYSLKSIINDDCN